MYVAAMNNKKSDLVCQHAMHRCSLVISLLLLTSSSTAFPTHTVAQPSSATTKQCQVTDATPQQQHQRLAHTAQQLIAPGKGILAADESSATMGRRFKEVGITNSLSNRAAWRHALLTTPDLDKFISGVILTEETFYQPLDTAQIHASNSDSDSSTRHTTGPRLVEALITRGVAVGVKVDLGTAPLNPDDPGPLFETETKGLEGLAQRCQQYAADGATFSKWRAVLRIDESRGWPTPEAVAINAQQLAQYAAVAQAAGLVPIVEPEVMVMEGAHGIEISEAVSLRVLSAVVHALLEQGVLLEGVVLKPAMVLPGSTSSITSSASSTAEEFAAATLRVLRRTVPPALPGIAFLSGGQGEVQAAQHLAAMNAACKPHERAGVGTGTVGCSCQPWALTFSFGRALQASALQAWARDPTDVAAGQQAFSRVAAVAAAAASRVSPATPAAAGTA